MSTGKILITGATGDAGGYAIERLLGLGREVRAVATRRTSDRRSPQAQWVEVVYGDLLDFGQVRSSFYGVKAGLLRSTPSAPAYCRRRRTSPRRRRRPGSTAS